MCEIRFHPVGLRIECIFFLLSAIGAISIEYLPDFYVIFLLFSERGLIPCLNSKIFSWTPWAVGHPKAVEI